MALQLGGGGHLSESHLYHLLEPASPQKSPEAAVDQGRAPQGSLITRLAG